MKLTRTILTNSSNTPTFLFECTGQTDFVELQGGSYKKRNCQEGVQAPLASGVLAKNLKVY